MGKIKIKCRFSPHCWFDHVIAEWFSLALIRDTSKQNALQHNALKTSQQGFTLVELIITVAIASILAFMAAPSMKEGLVNSKTKELSLEFVAALNLAQSEAIKRGIQVTMLPASTSANQWQTGWTIFEDKDGDGALDSGEEVIQLYDMPNTGLSLVSKDSTFSNWLAFLPSGAVRGNAGISGGFRICRADLNTQKSRKITVQASGNIIAQTGTAICP
jgi:type IV fimbrial biogenesis protein FimT